MTALRHTLLGAAVVAIGGLVLALATAVHAPAEQDDANAEPSRTAMAPVTMAPVATVLETQAPAAVMPATSVRSARIGEGAPELTVEVLMDGGDASIANQHV